MTQAGEALRQERLLRAVFAQGRLPSEQLRGDAARLERGLAAYAANGGATAERALAASFPTVRALVGETAFGALARACRQARPPARGDLFWMGAGLADFIEADAPLAAAPYLADVARLDWLVARAEIAPDASFDADSLGRLARDEPDRVALELRPGCAILDSAWPVMTIRLAHADGDDERGFALAREALAAGRGECVFVWRSGWRAQTARLAAPERRFMAALLERASLAAALDAAGEGFDFQAWLARALSAAWLHRARPIAQ